jgi:hypothetical protein
MHMDPSTVAKLAVWAARAARFLKIPGVVGEVRRRGALGYAKIFHADILTRLLLLSADLASERIDYRQRIKELIDFCTHCRFLICELSELQPNQIHCCIKILVSGGKPELDVVRTLARSLPRDGRAIADDTEQKVSENTVWSALLGETDECRNWDRPYNCFACNDLTQYHTEFCCPRPKWQAYYKSVVAFPLYYPNAQDHTRFDTVGFLVFDGVKAGAFPGLPDIFEYRTDWGVYHDRLLSNTIFHFGAATAACLMMALRAPYERGMLIKESGHGKPQRSRTLLE